MTSRQMMIAAEPVAGFAPPRFGGASLLNLAATLAAAHGAWPAYPLLADVKLREAMLAARQLVLWVIDGLGVVPLQRLAPDGALARSMRGELEAIFPSSTAPTLTTLATGRSPAVHAAPEWFLWLDEFGAVYRALPLDARDAAAGLPPLTDAAAIYPRPALTTHSTRACFAVLPEAIAESAYTCYAHAGSTLLGYRDAEGFIDAVIGAVDAASGPGYVFAYVDVFDAAAHEFGVDSDLAHEVALGLDRVFETLSARLAARGALLVVTADHGFIDVPPTLRLRLDAFAEVAGCLDRPLCGGPRAPIAYVRRDRLDQFPAVVEHAFGEHFVAVPSDLLADGGWFGPEPADPKLRARIGTHLLLPRGNAYLVQVLPGEPARPLIGMHGGRLDAETRVPLIVGGAGMP
jgi:hypothetical protein